MASILSVLEVDIKNLKSQPVQYSITAHGLVGSGGWTNPRLEPRYYINFPQDGLQDLDFVADPPSGLSIQPVLPIVANTIWQDPPTFVKGIRVHSANGYVESYFESASSLVSR